MLGFSEQPANCRPIQPNCRPIMPKPPDPAQLPSTAPSCQSTPCSGKRHPILPSAALYCERTPYRLLGRLEREFFIDNILVRIHFIIEMIWWTGLAPWEFEFPFLGSLISTFLVGRLSVGQWGHWKLHSEKR